LAVSWRDALIGAGAVIILSPISLSVSYYINKSLASPKLAIEYIAPSVETLGLTVDRSTGSLLYAAEQALGPIGQVNAFDPMGQECHRQISSGSLATSCVSRYRAVLPSELNDMKLERDDLESNRRAIAAWDRKSALTLIPIEAPNLPQSLESAAAENPRLTAMALNNDVNFLNDKISGISNFMTKLNDFAASPATRTGDVSFRVGILNYGDTDAVIFPSAGLLFHETHLDLRIANPTALSLGVGPVTTTSSAAPVLNVVRQHSFAEITLTVDTSTTSPIAQDAWRSLVKQKAQEQFTIEVNSSTERVSAKGWLPP
jgi:hypothetical protein